MTTHAQVIQGLLSPDPVELKATVYRHLHPYATLDHQLVKVRSCAILELSRSGVSPQGLKVWSRQPVMCICQVYCICMVRPC